MIKERLIKISISFRSFSNSADDARKILMVRWFGGSSVSFGLAGGSVGPTVVPPRRNQTGSFIGSTWIPPPGWKLFSARAMHDLYQDDAGGMVWVGGSTARRAALTLYGILNSTAASSPHVPTNNVDGPNIIDVNKARNPIQEPCERYSQPDHRFTNHTPTTSPSSQGGKSSHSQH